MLKHIEAIEQSTTELAEGRQFDSNDTPHHMLLGDGMLALLDDLSSHRPLLAERHWQFLLAQTHGAFTQGRDIVPYSHPTYPIICVMLAGIKSKVAEKSGVIDSIDESLELIREAGQHPRNPSEANMSLVLDLVFSVSRDIHLLNRTGRGFANPRMYKQLTLPRPDLYLIGQTVDDIRWSLK
jgi:hypothetical protein